MDIYIILGKHNILKRELDDGEVDKWRLLKLRSRLSNHDVKIV